MTWTATGPGIMPGQFDDFVLEANPMPDVETLTLPTFQTFADGTTDAWTEPAPKGSDPEFPVPRRLSGRVRTQALAGEARPLP